MARSIQTLCRDAGEHVTLTETFENRDYPLLAGTCLVLGVPAAFFSLWMDWQQVSQEQFNGFSCSEIISTVTLSSLIKFVGVLLLGYYALRVIIQLGWRDIKGEPLAFNQVSHAVIGLVASGVIITTSSFGPDEDNFRESATYQSKCLER